MLKITGTHIMTVVAMLAWCAGCLHAAETRTPTPEEFREILRQYNEAGKSSGMQRQPQAPKGAEQFNRAIALHTKKNPSPGDLKEAASLYQIASDAGIPQAATNLGLLYLEGKGVKKDVKKGVALLQAASKRKDSQADVVLARLYLIGTDVPKDEKKAEALLARAAKAGNRNAVTMLAEYKEWKKKNAKAMKEYQDIMKQLQAQQNRQGMPQPLQFMPPQSPAAIPYPVIPGYEYVSGRRPAVPNFITPSPQQPPQALNIFPQKPVAAPASVSVPPEAVQPITIVPQGSSAPAPVRVEAVPPPPVQKPVPQPSPAVPAAPKP